MFAKLTDKAFDSEDWIFEIKWDGYRAVAELDGENTRLYSRNGLSFAEEYAVIFQELAKIKKNAVLDGEIVALDEEGVPSFQNLQQYGQNKHIELVYYVFDVLYIDGKSVQDKTLLERKALLKKILPANNYTIKYCDHIVQNGIAFFDVVKKAGMEGVIAKRADSIYQEGARGNNWLKIKHSLTDEAIIAGYTQARGSRKHFGALVLGTYVKNKLTYIGHTGTGFTYKTLKELFGIMQPLITDENPFGVKIPINAPVTWLKPELVCQIKFTEITKDNIRRHPVFLGLREDKTPGQVHPETDTLVQSEKIKEPVMKKPAITAKNNFTNLDKVYWPDEGYTKGDMIAYYESMYKYIIPHIKGKPQVLKRNPNGIKGEWFYHKDAGGNAPDWIPSYDKWSESSGKTTEYLIVNDKPSLLYVANLGCIEINPWNSKVKTIDKPDYLVMDIDPSDKNTFVQVVDCALVIREILDKAGVANYCKTSGATGLHVYVPLAAKYDYETARQFAEIIAGMTQEQLPDFTTLERSLSKRGKDHIYIDYLQNKEGATLSCAYSLRPRPGAPVSTPLEWKEVKHSLDPLDFNIKNILKRVEKKGDLFAPVLKRGVNLEKALKKLS